MPVPPRLKRESPPVPRAILFTDIVGSTRYFAAHGDQAGMRMLDVHNNALFPLIEQANGRVVKTIGDSIMAVFVQPVNAVRAAFALQRRLEAVRATLPQQDQIHIRVGVHYGLVMEKDNDVFGDTVNLAERVKSSAEADQVFISRALRDLVRTDPRFTLESVGARELKGATEPVELFQLTDAPELQKRTVVVRLFRRGVRAVLHQPALSAVLLAVALVIGGGLWWRSRKVVTTSAIDSIAILPFVNQTRDPDTEYLSDGLTESIINSLTQLQNLRVSPRSSVFRYKGKDTDPLAAGNELNVRAILAGRLVQRGDSLTVSVELLDVRDNKQVWGEQYNRKVSDALAVQQEISREISERLRTRLTSDEEQRLAKRGTSDPEAYQFYLKGRYYWNRRTAVNIKKALDQFQQAVARDPTYALAYVGLADCYALLEQYAGTPSSETLPKARAAAQSALEIDSTLAEAHTSLAYINMFGWKFEEAEREFKRGFDQNPNYPTAHSWYGIFLGAMGRSDEAMAETQRARQLDPLSPIISVQICNLYMLRGDLNTGINECKKVLEELDPNFPRAHDLLGWAYLKQGRNQEALTELQKAVEFSGRASQELGYLGYGYGLLGRQAESKAVLKEMEERYARRETPAMFLAAIHAGLGNKDQAFAWLDKDFRAGSGALVYITYFPVYDTLRDDPRFTDLLRRMGLKH